jgi:hypothetical protein
MNQAIKEGNDELFQKLSSIRKGVTHTFELKDGRVAAAKVRQLTMSAKDAHELKKTIGDATRWTGQAFDNDLNKVRVKVYHAIDEMLDKEIPNIKGLNQRYANLLTAEKDIERRLHALSRFDLVSLKDIGIGGALTAGSLATGDSKEDAILKGLAFAGVSRLAGSTAVKSRMASGLAGLAKNPRASTTASTLLFGAKDIKKNPLGPRLPEVNVGLSIKDVSKSANNLKAEEVGRKINELNKRWVNSPTPANKRALESAVKLYRSLKR